MAIGFLVVVAAGPRNLIDLAGVPILSAIIFGPLVGASSSPSCHGRGPLIRWAALGVSLIVWLLSLVLVAAFHPNGAADFQFDEKADWIPAFGIQYKVGVDGLSLVLVAAHHAPCRGSASWPASAHQGPGEGVHDLLPDPRGRHARRLPRPRPVPLLHLLGDRARPDVPHHRHLGRRRTASTPRSSSSSTR